MPCRRMKRCRWLRSTDSGVGRQTISVAGETGPVIFERSSGLNEYCILSFGNESHVLTVRSKPKENLALVEPVAEVPHYE